MISSNDNSPKSAVPCQAVIGGNMMRVVLCDDNSAFLVSLRSEIRRILKRRKVEAEIYTYEQAANIPAHLISSSDVFFLDIDLAQDGISGLDLAKRIRQEKDDAIIVFLTNFIEYAPEGYEVQAFRYILKKDMPKKLESCLRQLIVKLQKERETIQINISGELLSIPLIDVLYIESRGHLALVHVQKRGTQTGKIYRFYSSLASLEQQLTPQGFLRIQKSYLVNMRRISKYQCKEALIDNGETLRVSEKNYAEQKKQFLLLKGRP